MHRCNSLPCVTVSDGLSTGDRLAGDRETSRSRESDRARGDGERSSLSFSFSTPFTCSSSASRTSSASLSPVAGGSSSLTSSASASCFLSSGLSDILGEAGKRAISSSLTLQQGQPCSISRASQKHNCALQDPSQTSGNSHCSARLLHARQGHAASPRHPAQEGVQASCSNTRTWKAIVARCLHKTPLLLMFCLQHLMWSCGGYWHRDPSLWGIEGEPLSD